MTRVADLFVAAGELAQEAGELDDALLLLAARLDLAGAGPALAAVTSVCWERHDEVCPRCGHEFKGTPTPHPRPPAPPKPPTDPKPGK